MGMWPRLVLPLLLLVTPGCSSNEVVSKCGPSTPPLPEGSSASVAVRHSDTGVAPVSVDGGLYGPTDEFATPLPSPAPPQSGTVKKTGGRLVLTTEDGRVIPLTLYFCD